MPFWRRRSSNTQRGQPLLTSPPPGPHELPSESSRRPAPIENSFLRRGDELFNEGDYSNAVFMYSEALRQDRHNASLYLKSSLARTLVTPAQLNEALQDVNFSIEIDPSMGQAWKQKGDICMRNGDFGAAEEALTQATGILQGWEKAQALQALADARSRRSTQTPSAPPPTAPTGLPVPSQRQSPQSNPQYTTLPTRTSPTHLAPPPAQSQPSLSPQIPAAGLASSPTSSAPRIPSPNPFAQGQVLAQQLEIPTEAPPQYTPAPTLPAGLGGGANYENQITNLESTLTTKRQGALYLRPFTAEGQIDSIQLLFYGKTYIESILLDLPPQTQVHPSWKKYHVDTIAYPGTTFIDLDCESAASHEGNFHRTISVLGYAEEYREHQLAIRPQLNLFLEAQTIPPVMTIGKIVERLQLLQRQPDLEDNTKLTEILGLAPAAYTLSSTRQTLIQNICMLFHRGQYVAPTRFIDFLTTGTLTRHVFGTGEGIGLTNFLFHILLGAELYIRLRKAGVGLRYTNIMTNTTSALVLIAWQWMENVTIRVLPPAVGSALGTANKHTLVAHNHTRQSEGLIRFAEALAWPYLDEARQYIENAYNSLIANPAHVHHYLKDWLYGLCLPGKYFRHRIMSCLVLASPSIKNISSAPYYDNGIVVGNKSYWPIRTVLGRVLGGLRNPKCACGWIGPVPAPTGFQTGWVLLNSRRVDFAMPVFDDYTEGSLEILGFSAAEATADPEQLIRDLSDLNKWNPPINLPARRTSPNTNTATVRLDAIRLQEVAVTGVAATTGKQYRAILDFMVDGRRVAFTLYSNPVFVHVPKCAGTTHPMHQRQVQKHFANIVHAKDLKNGENLPSTEELMIIDAAEPGEEAMARAWCAESGRHAVVRKNGIGCLTCAIHLATRRTGLGFGVLIWC